MGFPRLKKKTAAVPSFRLRNKHPKGKPAAIRVGDNDRPRSFTMPGIGQITVHDDTRLNAATNLARWGQTHHDHHRPPDPQAGGRATKARRQDGSDQHPTSAGETSLDDAGTDVHTAPAA